MSSSSFAVAFAVERRARAGRLGVLRSPLVYTLSLSIYCTAWTFYGAVGYAARSGLEFLTIYLGPTLIFVGWWWILRKLVRIGRQHRITSIADLISSRFGKSNLLGVIVTVMAVVAATPYIALQLQSVVLAFGAFATPAEGEKRPGWWRARPRSGSRRGWRCSPSFSARATWMRASSTTASSRPSRWRRWSSWWRFWRWGPLSSGGWPTGWAT